MYEMPLRYSLCTVNNYSRNISLHNYLAGLLNTFCFPCILASNLAWCEWRHISCWYTWMKMSSIPGAEPATYCQTVGMWPIVLFTKIIDLLCQKIYEHGITWCNPTITASIDFLPHRLKDRMRPFNPQKDLPSSWDFPGNKIPLWKSPCLCKNTSKFHLPQINLFYSIQQLCQQWFQSAFQGGSCQGSYGLSACYVLWHNQCCQSQRQTPLEKSWTNLEHNGLNRKKSPFSILFWALIRE